MHRRRDLLVPQPHTPPPSGEAGRARAGRPSRSGHPGPLSLTSSSQRGEKKHLRLHSPPARPALPGGPDVPTRQRPLLGALPRSAFEGPAPLRKMAARRRGRAALREL